MNTIVFLLILAMLSPSLAAEPLKTVRAGKRVSSSLTHRKKSHAKGAGLAANCIHHKHHQMSPEQQITGHLNKSIQRAAVLIYHQYKGCFSHPNPHIAYQNLIDLKASIPQQYHATRHNAVINMVVHRIEQDFLKNFASLPSHVRTSARGVANIILQTVIDELLAKNYNGFNVRYLLISLTPSTPTQQTQLKHLHNKQLAQCLRLYLLPSYVLEAYVQMSIEKASLQQMATIDGDDDMDDLMDQMEDLTIANSNYESEEQKQ